MLEQSRNHMFLSRKQARMTDSIGASDEDGTTTIVSTSPPTTITSTSSQSQPLNSSEMECLLEQYADCLGDLRFDSARELVDTFRSRHPPAFGNVRDIGWHCLMSAIVQLTHAERTYFSLHFLVPKGLLRIKEPVHVLRSNYNHIRYVVYKMIHFVLNIMFSIIDPIYNVAPMHSRKNSAINATH